MVIYKCKLFKLTKNYMNTPGVVREKSLVGIKRQNKHLSTPTRKKKRN